MLLFFSFVVVTHTHARKLQMFALTLVKLLAGATMSVFTLICFGLRFSPLKHSRPLHLSAT